MVRIIPTVAASRDNPGVASQAALAGCRCEPVLKQQAIVRLSEKLLRRAAGLCDKMGNLEWIAALVGTKVSDTEYLAEDFVVLDQEVHGTHSQFTAKGDTQFARMKTIGIIHSHNNMGVFFSGIDENEAVKHDVSIVTNNKGEFFGKTKFNLPCGGFVMKQAGFSFDYTVEPPSDAEVALIKERAPAPAPAAYHYGKRSYLNDWAYDWEGGGQWDAGIPAAQPAQVLKEYDNRTTTVQENPKDAPLPVTVTRLEIPRHQSANEVICDDCEMPLQWDFEQNGTVRLAEAHICDYCGAQIHPACTPKHDTNGCVARDALTVAEAQ